MVDYLMISSVAGSKSLIETTQTYGTRTRLARWIENARRMVSIGDSGEAPSGAAPTAAPEGLHR
jgi:hypothetical protein